ncbi:transcription factor HHO3-like [Tasmannia lanceolata]|uniref:transcription factor HHO3-like n=1 Tax=Tasmannia lanceolata TaxID=3420 RepID=UPI004064A21C
MLKTPFNSPISISKHTFFLFLTDKMGGLKEYVEALEEELKKIEVFHRELPLTFQLITQAIENCKHQIRTELLFPLRGGSDYEATSGESHPVLEEFIPLKRSSSSSSQDENQQGITASNKDDDENKPDWLRSVQLWNQDSQSDPPLPEKHDPAQKPLVVEPKKGRGAFQPFCNQNKRTESSSGGTGDEKGGHSSNRKARRCWSQELHRRFLHALQKLGGSHAATPKQIRELMKVDGLTNDEVKSHLQKYRLHATRPTQTIPPSGTPQPHQFVLVGGIWVPPSEYRSSVASTSIATHEIYAPVAILPSQHQQCRKQSQQTPTSPLHLEDRSIREEHSLGDDDNTNLNSPATSTTTSPPL